MTERTGAQILGVATLTSNVLAKRSLRSYKTYREMRLDPTIALARRLVIAPVLLSSWGFEQTEEAPPEAREFIEKQLRPLRIQILRSAMLGCIDFGWQSYEKVWELDDASGRYVIRKLKPLLHDVTDILVEESTGRFMGLRQTVGWNEIVLEPAECLLVSLDVEGTDWYGQATMEVARSAFDKWNNIEAAADRYDRKVAGTHWVIHYPRATSIYNGVELDNFYIAQQFLAALESSGSITIPRHIETTLDDLNAATPDAWKIELLADTSAATSNFIERQKYLDALKVRAFGLPERAVLEGQFGTKAEAESHADMAISDMEVRHQILCQLVNWHLVNPLLRYNFGEEADNSVYVEPAPIADLDRLYLRTLYQSILTNPSGFDVESAEIDTEALKERLGVPIKPAANIDAQGIVPGTRPGADDDPSLTDLDSHLPMDGDGWNEGE